MAVPKATSSNPPAQPLPQQAKTGLTGGPLPQQAKPERPSPNHQLKAEIFETLRHLNRGYGISLAAFDRLEVRDRQHARRAFTAGYLHDYRNRTEALRAQANRDLLRLLAGREEQEAERFSMPANAKPKRSS